MSDAFDGGDELRDLVRELKTEELGDEGLNRVAAALPMSLAGPGAGAAGAGAGGAATGGQAAVSSAMPVGLKLAGVLGALGLAVAAGVWIERVQRPVPAQPSSNRPAVEAAPAPEPETQFVAPLGEAALHRDEILEPEPAIEGSRRSRRTGSRAKQADAQEASEVAEEAEVQARLEEDRLLREARGILPADPRGALALTEQHRQRFPRGVLVQEREVVAIDALRNLGRGDEARRRAERVLSTWPNSAHRPRLESMGYH